MSSEIKTYRFILTPLDTIFFGGEKSPFKEEYFRKSNFFPQQTTVLGFLRYEILRRSGLLNSSNRNEWKRVIGESSWNGGNQSFGLVEKISPVSVYAKNDYKDFFSYRNPVGLNPEYSKMECCFGDAKAENSSVVYFKNEQEMYDAKNHSHFADVLTDFSGMIKKFECETDEDTLKKHDIKIPNKNDAVFIKDIQPGITKNYNGEAKEEGYFKTLYWRMVDGFAYSFKANIKTDEKIKNWLGTSMVTFGGETGKYLMEVKDDRWDELPATVDDIVVLTSDASLNNSIYDYCHFAVSESVNFRNLKTTVNDTRFTKRPVLKWYRQEDGSGRNTEPARVLMKKGSILFIKDKEKFLEAILNPAFQNIGYNHFKPSTPYTKHYDKQNLSSSPFYQPACG